MVKNPRTRAYAALALTFVLGVGAGAAGMYAALRREQALRPEPPGARGDERRVALLTERLGLDDAQRTAVTGLFARSREVWRQNRTRFEDDLRALLRPEQLPAYEEYLRERHAWSPPGAPPPPSR